MKILFAHQNFPAQFGAFGGWLSQRGWDVTYAAHTINGQVPEGTRLIQMKPHREPAKEVHPLARPLEQAVINGQAFANAASQLREQDGYHPDIVVAHSGWGSGTFSKAVWPETKFVAYTEWFYGWPPPDNVPSSNANSEEHKRANALSRNAPTLVDLAIADHVICPTHFQADTFPDYLRDRMTIQHDGVDAGRLAPSPGTRFEAEGIDLPDDAEIVTYATRGMEPHRGFPQFMEALARLQKTRPKLHALIGGEDRVAYGPKLPEGESWKKIMLDKLDLDLSRTHFTGHLARSQFTRLLQASHAHVYLSVPFVLSWSMIEAMSIGCPLVVSDVAPIREAVDEKSALFVDHMDVDALTAAIDRLLSERDLAGQIGLAARNRVLTHYDSRWLWPARADLLANVAKGRRLN